MEVSEGSVAEAGTGSVRAPQAATAEKRSVRANPVRKCFAENEWKIRPRGGN
jgi:hypothetical protein